MAGWQWLTEKATYDVQFIFRIILKTILLLVFVNLLYFVLQPLPLISEISIYNTVIPGRLRFPYSDNPQEAFNLSFPKIEGLFASHVINQEKKAKEYRVAIIGDSSVWGVLLDNSETISGCMNTEGLMTESGEKIVVYNLGYPVLSTLKDVLILEEAIYHDIDAVVWFTTLQAFFNNEQARHPIVASNDVRAQEIVKRYRLDVDMSELPQGSLFDHTLVGQRRELSDWLRLQVFGLAWWMTKDDYAPAEFLGAPVTNLPDSEGILNRPDIEIGDLLGQGLLSVDVFHAGIQMLEEQNLPLVVVNEPIFISQGLNSEVRYNEYYPRWAYDEFREWFAQDTQELNYSYVDLWDAVPATAFTDTPFHFKADYTCQVAEMISQELQAKIATD